MALSRRAFLTGSVSGVSLLVLTACTPAAPTPTATPSVTATPTATPTVAPGTVAPAALRRSSWSDDPYARGSTSFLAPGSDEADRRTLAGPLDDRVFFAGEAVSATLAGTVYGARQSGFDAAAALAAVADVDERIAVIGAGLAGATAARSLADRGFDVVVVEARSRVGGRIHSVQDDGWPFATELGVGILDGPGAPALTAALGLARVTTMPLGSTVDARTDTGATTSLGDVASTALTRASSWAANRSSGDGPAGETTVAEALSGSGADQVSTVPGTDGVSDADRLALLLDEVLPARYGTSADQLPQTAVPESAATAGLLPLDARLVTGGLSGFVAAQLDGLDVLRDSNVVRVQYGDQGVGLRFATGESLSVDRVVSTVPLGVLKSGTPEFAPELPTAYTSAIDALGVGTQEVLWLRFDEALWSTQATVWAVLDETSPYRLFVNLMPSTGAPIVAALTGGPAAEVTSALSDDDAVAAALQSLAPYLDLVAPEPTAPTGTDTPSVDPTP